MKPSYIQEIQETLNLSLRSLPRMFGCNLGAALGKTIITFPGCRFAFCSVSLLTQHLDMFCIETEPVFPVGVNKFLLLHFSRSWKALFDSVGLFICVCI